MEDIPICPVHGILMRVGMLNGETGIELLNCPRCGITARRELRKKEEKYEIQSVVPSGQHSF